MISPKLWFLLLTTFLLLLKFLFNVIFNPLYLFFFKVIDFMNFHSSLIFIIGSKLNWSIQSLQNNKIKLGKKNKKFYFYRFGFYYFLFKIYYRLVGWNSKLAAKFILKRFFLAKKKLLVIKIRHRKNILKKVFFFLL